MFSRRYIIPAAIVAALGAAGAGTVVIAKERGEGRSEARALQAVVAAPTTLAQAIATAERETGGRAVEAEVERRNDGFVYEVETVRDTVVRKLRIDMQTGQVISNVAGDADDED
jgi:uncharacterized membrane protein YkoI